MPGKEVISHDEETFNRLKNAGCVIEAPEPEEDTPPADNGEKGDGKPPAEGKNNGGKPPAAATKSAKTVAK